MSDAVGQNSVELTVGDASIGIAANGPVAYGYPARFKVRARSHEIERECELMALETFCDQLGDLHRSLAGTAKLEALEHDAILTLAAHEDGRVSVKAELRERFGGPFEWDFCVRFTVDQSYLLPLAHQLRAEFLNRADQ